MNKLTACLLSALCLIGNGAFAQEEVPKPSKEECTMACDDQSDACMSEAEGNDKKAKACDDAYAECLAGCS